MRQIRSTSAHRSAFITLARAAGRLLLEAAEVAQFHDPGLARIEPRELRQRRVERQQVGAALGRGDHGLVQQHVRDVAASLLRASLAGGVHQDVPDQLRGDREEVRPVLPLHATDVNQPQVGLVDDRSRLQIVLRSLASKLAVGDAPELGIDQWHEAVQRRLLATAPGNE